jgi:hypothetical protein
MHNSAPPLTFWGFILRVVFLVPWWCYVIGVITLTNVLYILYLPLSLISLKYYRKFTDLNGWAMFPILSWGFEIFGRNRGKKILTHTHSLIKLTKTMKFEDFVF